ncbi:MAG TPA: SPASM domain-containing protein, partial [Bryobacteraceae bacterium]|nr:SPASM domain-containing protein [Bryobacteraceae bacterium]
LIVSLDGPAQIHNRVRRVANAFELLASGVSRLRALREGYPVAARCTVQRLNCAHLAETVDSARRLGLDSISFLAADIHSTAFNRHTDFPVVLSGDRVALNIEEVRLLDEQIEILEASGHCGRFVRESPAKLRRIAYHFRCYLGLAEPVAPACNAPWNSAVIETDGSVKPCFFHPSVGFLADGTSLRQVLNGPEAMLFRAELNVAENAVCRRCVCALNWRAA